MPSQEQVLLHIQKTIQLDLLQNSFHKNLQKSLKCYWCVYKNEQNFCFRIHLHTRPTDLERLHFRLSREFQFAIFGVIKLQLLNIQWKIYFLQDLIYTTSKNVLWQATSSACLRKLIGTQQNLNHSIIYPRSTTNDLNLHCQKQIYKEITKQPQKKD